MTLLRLEFTNAFEDYREAQFAHSMGATSPKQAKVSMTGQLIGWALFGGLAVVFFILLQMRKPPSVVTPLPPVAAPAISFSYVLGMLLPWIFVFAILWAVTFKAFRPSAPLRGNLGFRKVSPGNLKGAVGLAFATLLMGGLIVYVNHANSPAEWTGMIALAPWIVLAGALFIIVRRSGEWTARRGWEGQPHLSRPNVVELTEEKLIVQDPQAQHQFAWTSLPAFCETPNLLLIYVSDLGFVIIPKRAFTDDAQLEAARQVLQSKIGDPTQAFPVLPVAPLPLPLPAAPVQAAERRAQ